ncbi:ECF-type sigma factor [Sphingomonas sp. TREG-RG-20F-R18-01]|uniref:RNA polymerase sigma factor n=1 Tax=Sphingomonas sp. TREG-RG-20F-R18-01 TaxID=2914982 RepID=UPI001F56537B|nr:ECF-type sigma factor [Sphingomonas sp. TREG-RG-20F-R18-01]
MTFDDAVREYSGMLRRRAFVLEDRPFAPEADDLLQETLLQVWLQWEWVTLVGPAMIRHRMFRILGQQCVAGMKRMAASKRGGNVQHVEFIGVDLPVAANQEDAFDLKRAADAVAQMRPQRGTAIAMWALGYEQHEIGDQIGGISPQAVQQHINSARKELERKKS